MKRICLFSHGQPSSNPRMVREADALVRGGYDVVVLSPRIMSRWVDHDRALIQRAHWRYIPVDFIGRPAAWQYVRLRRALCRRLSRSVRNQPVMVRAVAYSGPEIAAAGARENADLYIAHQHYALPAAAMASEACRALLAFDAEDLLRDCWNEPVHLVEWIEREYLNACVYVSTMSSLAAHRLQETNGMRETPLVLRNVPSLSERDGLLPPAQRPESSEISIYWFGQTIGPHSRAEELLRAFSILPAARPRLVLRGHPLSVYTQSIQRLARDLNVSDRLQILPLAGPREMVRLAADHDILWGSQPRGDLFHELAIGNKVLTGMMAGTALALADTPAHRDLLSEAPGCGFLVFENDAEGLASALGSLIADREKLRTMRQTAWSLAETQFNWECESAVLLKKIDSLLEH